MKSCGFWIISLIVLSGEMHAQIGWYQVPGPWGNRNVSFSGPDIVVGAGPGGRITRSTDAGLTWSTVLNNADYYLRAVRFRNEVGLAIGELGLILRSSDNGATWEERESGTSHALIGIGFLNNQKIFVVGDSGTILSSTDDGLTWIPLNSGTQTEFRSISFMNDSIGIIAGFSPSMIVRTTNGGNSWMSIDPPDNFGWVSVFLDSTGKGVAVGLWGATIVTSDGGLNWEARQHAPLNQALDVFYFSSEKLTIAGFGSMCHSTNAGQSWEIQAVTFGYAVSFGNENIGVASTGDGLLRTTTGGMNDWYRVQSSVSRDLHSVAFQTLNVAAAIGDSGTIARSTDQGETWSAQISGTTATLHDIACSPTIGIIVGDSGIVLRTTDYGETWLSQVSGTMSSLQSVCFISSTIVMAVGLQGTILRSTNAGLSWQSQPSAPWPLYSVSFANSSQGLAVGGGALNRAVRRSFDGGQSWVDSLIPASSPVSLFHKVSVTPSGVGFILGSSTRGRVLQTTDFGLNWEVDSTGTPKNLNGIFVKSDNEAWCVGVDGTLLKTTDSGEIWISQIGQMAPQFPTLNDIEFANDSLSLAVGVDGLIIKKRSLETLTSVRTDERTPPSKIRLEQNYPNPFNPRTTIQFNLAEVGRVTLTVYDILGQELGRLVDDERYPGSYSVVWDASGYSSGIYFYRLTIGAQSITRKLMLVR